MSATTARAIPTASPATRSRGRPAASRWPWAFVESGLTKAGAIDALLAASGTLYDPEAVRLFLKVSNLVQLPKQVREIMLDDLEPGMILANGIYSPHGLLLIGEGQSLSTGTIAKIRSHNQVTPISQRLLVYS